MSSRTYALFALPAPAIVTETGQRTEAVFTVIVTETTSITPPFNNNVEWLIRARRRGRR